MNLALASKNITILSNNFQTVLFISKYYFLRDYLFRILFLPVA